MTAWTVWALILTVPAAAAAFGATLTVLDRRRWALEDDDPAPFLPPPDDDLWDAGGPLLAWDDPRRGPLADLEAVDRLAAPVTDTEQYVCPWCPTVTVGTAALWQHVHDTHPAIVYGQ